MSKGEMKELRAEWERAARELEATREPALRSAIRANMRDIAFTLVPALLEDGFVNGAF